MVGIDRNRLNRGSDRIRILERSRLLEHESALDVGIEKTLNLIVFERLPRHRLQQ
jgi:hypothetical protein